MDNLETLRKLIDEIDSDLITLLGKRLQVVKKVGEYKRKNNLPIVDPSREEKLINKLEEKGKKNAVPKQLIENVWKAIFQSSYKAEEKI